jgi:hypothetical protein
MQDAGGIEGLVSSLGVYSVTAPLILSQLLLQLVGILVVVLVGGLVG